MKKNILFISTGSLAFGESVMALAFARSLPKELYNPCFIVSPLNAVLLDHQQLKAIQLLDNAHKINRLLVEDFLEKYPPELIILCDFLTFDFSQMNFGITLKFLRSYNKPIISLDSYEWESGDFVLDFFSGLTKQLPRTLLLLDGAIRPCPLNKPTATTERAICYSFLHQINDCDLGEVAALRREIGIGEEDFVIFSATAVWQAFRPKQKYGGPFGHIITDLLTDYIAKLGTKLHWIRVGPERNRSTQVIGDITEHNFPSLPEKEFDQLLAAADILITNNVASTTLAKCISYGRSALLLYNSIQANTPDDLAKYPQVQINSSTLKLIENSYPIQPFRMFPLGWYNFLSPIMKDNPYLETFYGAEILDEEKVLSILRQAKAGKNSHFATQRKDYQQQLATLPSPAACLEHFMGIHAAKIGYRENTVFRMEYQHENP